MTKQDHTKQALYVNDFIIWGKRTKLFTEQKF